MYQAVVAVLFRLFSFIHRQDTSEGSVTPKKNLLRHYFILHTTIENVVATAHLTIENVIIIYDYRERGHFDYDYRERDA